MLYAVQYRNMHTAIHHLTIFTKRKPAETLLAYIKEHQEMPEGEFRDVVTDIEINFRDVPETYKDEKLTIVNLDPSPPDCYC